MLRSLAVVFAFAPVAAFAQDAGAGADSASQYASVLPLVFVFGIFYFLLIRPQQKQMKAQTAMRAALAKGDEVVTAGGIVGKITKIEAGDHVVVEIAKGVEVSVVKSTLTTVLGKTPAAPAKAAAPEKKKSANKNDNKVPARDSIANDN